MLKDMFRDLFDFSKTRTLKESIVFFVFHSGIVMVVFGVLSLMGIA